ncbi:UDP-glucuronosyltransferase 1-9 [Toxocara canis]|uniref:glucuronosyltransferase n=1 Tax=Toxocara canis TaxID=6265 RepID=A0A0B2VDC2_TOXCA|nr:UDP-glucuronosyltransferase 1-9 [Toxocara canis]
MSRNISIIGGRLKPFQLSENDSIGCQELLVRLSKPMIFINIGLAVFISLGIQASEILLGVMPQGKSHAGSFMPLLHELIQQGHNVTIYMDNYGMNTLGVRVNEWFINVTDHKDPYNDTDFSRGIWKNRFTFISQVKPFYYGALSCKNVLNDHRTDFERLVNYPWDLILTDSLFAVCAYGIAELSHAHHIVMHSTDVESGYGTSKGYARNYLMMPRYFLEFDYADVDITHFNDRFWSAYEWFGTWMTFATVSNSHMRNALSPVISNFDISKYYAESSMSFTDMPLHLYVPMATNNELFIYGAYCRSYRSLSGEIATFVDDHQSKGTILIAFGTIVDWSIAPNEKLNTFIEALNQLTDYRIIWAFNGKELPIKKHIKFVKWLPQNDILNHKRTKLFITHGGLKSIKEATCATVPMLIMPMFAEQVRNSWLTRHHGFGKMINKVNFTSASLVESIREMITNPDYKNNVKRLRRFYDDTPIPALKEAAFKINRLLKYGGRMPDYFYTRSTKLSFFTFLNIDLLVLFPALLIFLLSIR